MDCFRAVSDILLPPLADSAELNRLAKRRDLGSRLERLGRAVDEAAAETLAGAVQSFETWQKLLGEMWWLTTHSVGEESGAALPTERELLSLSDRRLARLLAVLMKVLEQRASPDTIVAAGLAAHAATRRFVAGRARQTFSNGHDRRVGLLVRGAQALVVALAALYVTFAYHPDYNVLRLQHLDHIRYALDLFQRKYGHYPVSEGFDGIRSPIGAARRDWIRGLVPEFMKNLPNDPANSPDGLKQYLYSSDGRDYKLIAHDTGDCERVRSTNPNLVDPVRVCFAYGYWTPGGAGW